MPSNRHFQLADRQTLDLGPARGQTLHCLQGGLWITWSEQADDFFLQPGESLSLPRRAGRVVIEGLGESRCREETPVRFGWPFAKTRTFHPAASPTEHWPGTQLV